MGWPITVGDGEFKRWKRSLKEIACGQNVRLTISAIECVFGMEWDVAQAQLWIEAVMELFGTERVMFGSHRPISKLARNVARPHAAYKKMTQGLSEAERDAVFRTNAARWFGRGLDRGRVRFPESAQDLV